MNFKPNNPGVIALDIDGTITVDHHPISQEVIAYLSILYHAGWKFIFITGRTFLWGYEVLQTLPFPYMLAVQNGALLVEMPSQKIVSKKYLSKTIIPAMEEICHEEPTDFVIYTGFENRDTCYYRSSHFSLELREYLAERSQMMKEAWIDIRSFDELPIKEFSSVKCFGRYDSALRISVQIEQRLGLHIPLIRDPYYADYFVAQATNPEADKGAALLAFLHRQPEELFVIAAGDDLNDKSMMEVASCKVVMATAPKELLDIADVIAPPAKDNGIITALKLIIK